VREAGGCIEQQAYGKKKIDNRARAPRSPGPFALPDQPRRVGEAGRGGGLPASAPGRTLRGTTVAAGAAVQTAVPKSSRCLAPAAEVPAGGGADQGAGQYLKEAASPSAFGSASDLCHQFKKAWGARPNAMPLAGIAGGRVESDLDKAAPLLSKSIVVGLLSEVTRVTGLEGGQKPARHFHTPPQLAQPALRLHGGPAWPSAHTRLWGCLERKGAIAWAGTAAKCPKLWFDPCYFFCVRCVCLLIVLCLRNHSAAAGAPVSTRNKSR
jgi:hypothetical protein